MNSYVGIDVSEDELVVHVLPAQQDRVFPTTHLFEQGFQQTQKIEAQFNPTEDDRDHIREHRRLELGFFPQNLVFERKLTGGTGSYIVVERAPDYLPRPQGQVTLWEPNSTGRYHRVASKRVADFLYNPSFTAPA